MVWGKDAGVVGRIVGRESRAVWVLLTDAWHLDGLHLSRPECRRTEPSPKEVILKEEKWAWLQICAT